MKIPYRLSVTIAHKGHAGAFAGLELATEMIRTGRSNLVLVGGVESYFHADTIDWLIDNGQLAMDGSRSPFLPGEGAAAVALMSGSLRIPSLAVIRGSHTAIETSLIKTDDVNLAWTLTSVVRQAATSLRLPHEAIDSIWCDLNGERYRTDEWSYVLLRLPQLFRQLHGEPTRYNTAVEFWGDMGAATGALLVVLAVNAWQRLYAKGPRALLFAGSEQGLRSAIVLEQGA
ncbi:beta-ketoacyl synthase N-terminal-like domain-containing protein [Myxococcus stipitatus]|uniref:beta-ketoacyl synthase N-terminal-like domain-containing protein n=1 Tax=Myxococcus stipitatus TaxID=83455 RepID=UPI001185A810|nr:beta-ketoacyl synthase N-terminal-like domain-containing protein [Myxococcus stipitatus]